MSGPDAIKLAGIVHRAGVADCLRIIGQTVYNAPAGAMPDTARFQVAGLIVQTAERIEVILSPAKDDPK